MAGLTLIVAPLSTTESFSAVTRARSKSHTTPNTGCAQTLYKCEISQTLTHAMLRSTENLEVSCT